MTLCGLLIMYTAAMIVFHRFACQGTRHVYKKGVMQKLTIQCLVLFGLSSIMLWIFGAHGAYYQGWRWYVTTCTLANALMGTSVTLCCYLATCAEYSARNLTTTIPTKFVASFVTSLVVILLLNFTSMILVLVTNRKAYAIIRHVANFVTCVGAGTSFLWALFELQESMRARDEQRKELQSNMTMNSESKHFPKASETSRPRFLPKKKVIITVKPKGGEGKDEKKRSRSERNGNPCDRGDPHDSPSSIFGVSSSTVPAKKLSGGQMGSDLSSQKSISVRFGSSDITNSNSNAAEIGSPSTPSAPARSSSPSRGRASSPSRSRSKEAASHQSAAILTSSCDNPMASVKKLASLKVRTRRHSKTKPRGGNFVSTVRIKKRIRFALRTYLVLLLLVIVALSAAIYYNAVGEESYQESIEDERDQYSIAYDLFYWISIAVNAYIQWWGRIPLCVNASTQ